MSFEYKANVKDKVKRLEAKTNKIPALATTTQPKLRSNNLSSNSVVTVTDKNGPEVTISSYSGAAVMDVEITQLNNSPTVLPKVSVNGNNLNSAEENDDDDTKIEPPVSVKSLLRRFSSGMTHTFRKKTTDQDEVTTMPVSKTKLTVPGNSAGSTSDGSIIDLDDDSTADMNNSSKKEVVILRSKAVSHKDKNTILTNGFKKSINISKSNSEKKAEIRNNNNQPSLAAAAPPVVKSRITATTTMQIQQQPQPKNSPVTEGSQSSFGLSKLLHFQKNSTKQNQKQENEKVVASIVNVPTPPSNEVTLANKGPEPQQKPNNTNKDSEIPPQILTQSQSAKNDALDKEINNNSHADSLESPKPKPRTPKPIVVQVETDKNLDQHQHQKMPVSPAAAAPTDTVLVIGPHQAGKSSVVNYLLHQDLSPAYKSTPPSQREIVECIAKTSTTEGHDIPSSLVLIDTPGFRNDKSDAAMWSALTSHLLLDNSNRSSSSSSPTTTTPHLLDQGPKQLLPFLIIVVVGVDESGNFVEPEEFPNFFKLVSHYWLNAFKGFPKLLFVISHSAPLDILRAREAVKQLSNMTKQYFPIRVCFHRIIHKNGTTKNPHESLASTYPDLLAGLRSFFIDGDDDAKSKKSSKDSSDQQKFQFSNSSIVLKHIFGPTYPKTLMECFLSKRIPLKSLEHPETLKAHKILQNLYQNVVIEPTEISTLLEIGYENVDTTLRKKYPSSLLTLQQVMQKCGIKTFSNLPQDPIKVFQLLKHIPQHNPAITDLLTETLQLKIPSCYSALYIGQGFDLSKDSVTHVSPFQLSGTLKTSSVGLVPEEISCKVTEEREIIFKFYSTLEEYALDRFKDLGIQHATFPKSGTASSPIISSNQSQRIGYNIVKQPAVEPSKTTTCTANVEYRTFQLSLSREDIEFKPQFWDTLSSLPELDVKNLETIDCWSEFFKYWGTHVVKAAFGGGSIQVNFRGRILSKIFKSLNSKSNEILTDELETSRVFHWLTGDGLDFARPPNAKTEFMQGIDVDTSFNGGDMKFQQIDLTKLSHEGEAGSTREEWIQSLLLNPVILETSLVLVPLSYFVREKSEGLATKMDIAFLHFYSNFMALQGKQSACSIL